MNRKNFLRESVFPSEPTLFPKKSLYISSCSKTGHPYLYDQIKSTDLRELCYENMHLIDVNNVTSDNEWPIIQPYVGRTDFEVVAFNKRHHLPTTTSSLACHFFICDYLFDSALLYHIEKTTYTLRPFSILFAPDYSQFVDKGYKSINIINIMKNRVTTAHWQRIGRSVIPVVGWGNVDSFEYCLEGLPNDSILAVCGVGHSFSLAARNLFLYGLRRTEEQLQPRKFLIYGPQEDLPGIHTPVQFIEDNITKNFR